MTDRNDTDAERTVRHPHGLLTDEQRTHWWAEALVAEGRVQGDGPDVTVDGVLYDSFYATHDAAASFLIHGPEVVLSLIAEVNTLEQVVDAIHAALDGIGAPGKATEDAPFERILMLGSVGGGDH